MMKIIAITDESDHCECCGKNNLKKVVVLMNDDGDFVRYGVNCAARAMGWNKVKTGNMLEAVEVINAALKIHTPPNAIQLVQCRYPNARLMGGYEEGVFKGYIMMVGTPIRVHI